MATDALSMPSAAGGSLAADAVRRLRRDPAALVSGLLILAMVIVAIFAPFIAPHAYDTQDRAYASLPAPPDGKHLLSADKDGKIILWSATGKSLITWQLPGSVYEAIYAPDSRHVVLANSNGTVYLLRLAPMKN